MVTVNQSPNSGNWPTQMGYFTVHIYSANQFSILINNVSIQDRRHKKGGVEGTHTKNTCANNNIPGGP